MPAAKMGSTKARPKSAKTSTRGKGKTGASPTKTSGAGKQPVAGEVGVRVRMYRVGFGDCFLVSFPAADGSRAHVLIDCGVFKGQTGKGDLGSIEAAVDDIAQETAGKLALVVMTHRHADHIAGFSRCAKKFASFQAEAVWMPIWESEYGPAQKSQAIVAQVAFGLQAHLKAQIKAGADDDHREALDMLYDATGVDLSAAAATGHASNAASLAFLKTGLGVKPTYYKAGDEAKLPPTLAAAGVNARILGPPPVEDADLMKLMDLQRGVGEYLAASGSSAEDDAEFAPFGDVWTAKVEDCYGPAFKEWAPRSRAGNGATRRSDLSAARQRMEKALEQQQPAAALIAAKALDAFLNNQSLVILFTIKGKNLLFVGDAQAGNWEHWLYGIDTAEKAPHEALSPDAQHILGALDFYKVGHHGSTNATPIPAITAMAKSDRFVAMCSTQEGVYGKPANNSEVPRAPLMKALADECDLVRSDQISLKTDGSVVPPGAGAPKVLPKPKRGRIVAGGCWIDYLL